MDGSSMLEDLFFMHNLCVILNKIEFLAVIYV